jgi:hypothetical protein
MQVRKEFLRLIVVHHWNCGICAIEQDVEFRRLNYATIQGLRISCLAMLKELSYDRFIKIRDESVTWLFTLSAAKQLEFFTEYDEALVYTEFPKGLGNDGLEHFISSGLSHLIAA